ncbi:MAG: hypothetical protein QF886_21440, partial [Planctomycetota bacterium]|nr:hypothetical protein [Planctomycetota bacterium]
MLNIGTRKQLFIDDRFIESARGMHHCMNPPIQFPEMLLTNDQPWEAQGIGAYNTVLRENGRFRMWYDAGLKGGLPAEGARRLCYAESDDGLSWRKPTLGLLPFRGSKENNIVAPLLERQSLQGGSILIDERLPESERYRLWTKFLPTNEERENGASPGLWAMYSSDGIHWNYYEDQPNRAARACDTQNVFFWDDRIEEYVGYTRVAETQHSGEAAERSQNLNKRGEGRYRSIGRITSPDFMSWSELEIVFEADAEDLALPVPSHNDDPRPNLDIYTNCAQKYSLAQDVYLMFPSFYYHWGEDEYPATMDVQMLTSRDGISWQRAGGRHPFLRQGFDGTATSGMVFANPWLIPMGDELWMFYSGTSRHHGAGKSAETFSSGIFRAVMRLDGFVSLDADANGGTVETVPLRIPDGRLEVNVDATQGSLAVEVLFPDGRI